MIWFGVLLYGEVFGAIIGEVVGGVVW